MLKVVFKLSYITWAHVTNPSNIEGNQISQL